MPLSPHKRITFATQNDPFRTPKGAHQHTQRTPSAHKKNTIALHTKRKRGANTKNNINALRLHTATRPENTYSPKLNRIQVSNHLLFFLKRRGTNTPHSHFCCKFNAIKEYLKSILTTGGLGSVYHTNGTLEYEAEIMAYKMLGIFK